MLAARAIWFLLLPYAVLGQAEGSEAKTKGLHASTVEEARHYLDLLSMRSPALQKLAEKKRAFRTAFANYSGVEAKDFSDPPHTFETFGEKMLKFSVKSLCPVAEEVLPLFKDTPKEHSAERVTADALVKTARAEMQRIEDDISNLKLLFPDTKARIEWTRNIQEQLVNINEKMLYINDPKNREERPYFLKEFVSLCSSGLAKIVQDYRNSIYDDCGQDPMGFEKKLQATLRGFQINDEASRQQLREVTSAFYRTNSDHADKVLTNLGVKTLMNSDGIKGAQNLAEVHAKVSTLEGPNTCMTQLFLQEKQLSQRALNVWYDVVRSSATAILNAATMCFPHQHPDKATIEREMKKLMEKLEQPVKKMAVYVKKQLEKIGDVEQGYLDALRDQDASKYTPREWVQELQKIFDDKGPYGTVRTYIAARQNGTSGHNTNTSYAVFADMASFVIRNPERTWRPINQQDFDEHVKNLSNPAYTAQGANATVTQLYEQAHRQLSKDFPNHALVLRPTPCAHMVAVLEPGAAITGSYDVTTHETHISRPGMELTFVVAHHN